MADPTRADLAAAVKRARAMFAAGTKTAIATRQRETTIDRDAKGPSLVSRVVFPAPAEDGPRQVVLDAINTLGVGDERYKCPALVDVRAQWTGFRSGVPKDEPEPAMSEAEKFLLLIDEVRCNFFLFFFGARIVSGFLEFGFMSSSINGPATRRATATKLAQLTSGRCLIVQPRLAPQNPFPAALLDVLVAYLSLLYPPPGSHHAPVLPSHVVFAGDSSGAQLALSLILTILAAQQRQATSQVTLRFHKRTVELPLPAGIAIQSPSLDHQGDCLPSWYTNGAYDIFLHRLPTYEPGFPADEIWPTEPPRGNLYCETSMLCHPLVSPVAAKFWRGAPPIYVAVGSTERVADAAKVVAQAAARQGVPVLWDEYEFMPHNWPMILTDYPQTVKCYEAWARACSSFVQGDRVRSAGTFTTFEGLRTRKLDVEHLTYLTDEEVGRLMRSRQGTIKPWTNDLVVKPVL
ncbi:MAG: hypothetical protein Q9187_006151 [Circinaria calcarea]